MDPYRPSFESTGPQGHRGRMRGRLLARAEALADYEIVEMLLFLGIPRRDTKPKAKELLNRFGGFVETVTSEGRVLSDMPSRVAEVFELVARSAVMLARAERVERVVLGDWDALDGFLMRGSARAEGISALLLNGKHQLLAECRLPEGEEMRVLLREALERHATAVFLVRGVGEGEVVPTGVDRRLLAQVREGAEALSVGVHGMVVAGRGDWVRVDGV